jgi:hypothetical protein
MHHAKHQTIKPLFLGAASEDVFSGVFGPAPIPTDDGSATADPESEEGLN